MNHEVERVARLSLVAVVLAGSTLAQQSVYIPSGTGGIGSSANSNVGIGVSAPATKFEMQGDELRVRSTVGKTDTTARTLLRLTSDNTVSVGNLQLEFTLQGSGTDGQRHALIQAADFGYNWATLALNPNGGNVGIGTTAPNYALSLGSTLGRGIAVFESSGGANRYGMFAGGNGSGGDPYRLLMFANGSEVISATYQGNVGIGTAAPSRRLEVSGAGSIYSKVTSTNSNDAALHFSTAGGDAYIGRLPTSGGGSGTLDFYNGGLRMVIDPTGNIGIGTTSPSHKLAVNGTIRAKEVIVDTGWADHVFADDYRLAPLDEVDAHIQEKRHLPGIPSAAEVAANGISLGEMQAKLLEKIEELTLHAIRQERRAAAQQAEIEKLHAQIAALARGDR